MEGTLFSSSISSVTSRELHIKAALARQSDAVEERCRIAAITHIPDIHIWLKLWWDGKGNPP